MSQHFTGVPEKRNKTFFRKPPAHHSLPFMHPLAGDIEAGQGAYQLIARVHEGRALHEGGLVLRGAPDFFI